jgi:PmbA protein
MSNLDVLADLVAAAKRAGADTADALHVENASLSVARRLGKIEQLERAEGMDIGLRVFVGRRQAIVSTTDPDPRGFALLAERAVAMAQVVPEDPFGGLADALEAPRDVAALDLFDPTEPSAEDLIARATAAEDAALAVQGITNSEGAEASWGRVRVALVTSAGFGGAYTRSSHGISVTALAGSGTAMERDYDFSSAVHLADLEDPATLGRRAAERTLARLNPVRAKTARIPVVFDPRVSASLMGHLVSAINGAAVARGTSFLRDRLGTQVLAKGLTLRDDPTRPRGLRSRPFDGEGMAGAPRAIVEDGVLTTWILDWRSARQLGLASTGHASRGTGGPPGPAPTNLWLEPGEATPQALMADIAEGLYVTDLIGMGVNGVTGDYSRGAAGFMIRGGALAEAVSEITIAGHLKEMFLNITAANDLKFRRGSDAPTLRVEGLTLAGA